MNDYEINFDDEWNLWRNNKVQPLTAEDYKLLVDCEDAKDVLKALDAIEQKDKDNVSTK